MQTDGYSLDAQKARMKAYAGYNDYEIVSTYEDAGKSGKSIEGRLEFNRMMEDVKIWKKCSGCTFCIAGYAGFWGKSDLCGGWH